MGFHRLAVPTYYGGLPSGYDYINNAVSGTPAPADGAKSSGPNVGTYFVAFGEDATSSNTNRANSALAENCDILDNLFRTSQPVMRYVDHTASGTESELSITGEVYVGGSVETPAVVNDQYTRNGLARVTDQEGNELSISGTIVTVSDIVDGSSVSQIGVPASGFFTNPKIQFTPSIPNGVNYRIYYLVRRSLADIIPNKPGEYLSNQMRTIERIPATLHWGGMDEKYRRASVYDDTPPTDHPVITVTRDTDGDGSWFKKDSYPLTAYFAMTGTPSGTLNDEDYMYGAGFATSSRIILTIPGLATRRHSVGSGFVVRGNDRSSLLGSRTPGLFGFMHMIHRRGTPDANDHTRLAPGGTATINGDQITLTGSDYFYKTFGSPKTGFVKGMDILVMSEDATGDLSYFTITAFTSDTVATLRYLDGSHPAVSGPAAFTIVEWQTPLFYTSDGSSKWASIVGLATNLPDYAGFVFAEPPYVRDSATYGSTYRRYVRLFGPDQLSTTKVLGWGGHNELDPTGSGGTYEENSWLYADGGGKFNKALEVNGAATGSVANDALPALKTTVAPSNFKLLWEVEGSAAGALRLYASTSDFYFTQNAYWTGTQWNHDNVGTPSVYYAFRSDGVLGTATANASADPVAWNDEQSINKYTVESSQYDSGGVVDTTYFTMPNDTSDVALNDGADLKLTFSSVKVGDRIRVWFHTDHTHGAQDVILRLAFEKASVPATYSTIPGSIVQLEGTQHVCLVGQYECTGSDETSVVIWARAQNVVADNTNVFQGGWSMMAELIRPE